jgi:hypothetical protein
MKDYPAGFNRQAVPPDMRCPVVHHQSVGVVEPDPTLDNRAAQDKSCGRDGRAYVLAPIMA